MAYFPESVMPNRLKDETQDIKGNKFIVTAADVNKHDEEIRAIERVIGIRRPRTPVAGFSGTCDASGDAEFVAGCDDADKVDGLCPGEAPAACENDPSDAYAALQNIADALEGIRDDYMLMTSGLVAIRDPSVSGVDGKIVFPSDWPTATLQTDIPDGTVDEEEDLPDISSIVLSDVSDLPEEGGYITIINDASTILFRSGSRNIRLIGFTSLAESGNPIYTKQDISLETEVTNKQRIFGLGTNVEILQYESLDVSTKTLSNVSRKQLGTSSTRHGVGDLVFKGRVSITVSPVNYRLDRRRIDQVDCVLRSDGSVDLRVRNRDRNQLDPDDDDDTTLAWAHYHAVLLRELEPIPSFDSNSVGNCT